MSLFSYEKPLSLLATADTLPGICMFPEKLICLRTCSLKLLTGILLLLSSKLICLMIVRGMGVRGGCLTPVETEKNGSLFNSSSAAVNGNLWRQFRGIFPEFPYESVTSVKPAVTSLTSLTMSPFTTLISVRFVDWWSMLTSYHLVYSAFKLIYKTFSKPGFFRFFRQQKRKLFVFGQDNPRLVETLTERAVVFYWKRSVRHCIFIAIFPIHHIRVMRITALETLWISIVELVVDYPLSETISHLTSKLFVSGTRE